MELQNVSQIFQNPERTISGTSNTVQADDYILLCDTSAGVVNVELLEIPDKFDREYKLYIIDDSGNAATNNITINAPAGHLINGDASLVINKNDGAVILRFVKLGHYAAFGALNATTATSDINIYKDDGTLTAERRLTFGGFNLGFIGTEQFGVGVEPNAIGVSTEAGGIDDTTVQFHVAGAIRTDNWYHGRFGLLLHQPNQDRNVAVGTNTMESLTTGLDNVSAGKEALRDLETSNGNTAVGAFSQKANVSSSGNTSFGNRSLENNTATNVAGNSGDNTAIGDSSMQYGSHGGNTAVGADALSCGLNSEKRTGNIYRNVSIGYQSMLMDAVANAEAIFENVAVGFQALHEVTGSRNVAIGANTLDSDAMDSDNNTAVGYGAGGSVAGGSGSNVFLGSSSGDGIDKTLAKCIGIGAFTNFEDGIEESVAIGTNVFARESNHFVTGQFQNPFYHYYWGKGHFTGNTNLDGEEFIFSTTDVTYGATYDPGNSFVDKNNNSTFLLTGGGGTGTGKGGDLALGAYLPTSTGNDRGVKTELLKVLGSAMVDQTTNVEIIFDNGGTLTTRKIEVGPVDSAGASYRQLRILN
jgi:hypothetical protein